MFLMYSSFLQIRSPCISSIILNRLIDFTVLSNFICHNFNGFLQPSLFKLAFPYYDYEPSLCFQLPPYILVPFLIARNLGNPEVGVGFRDCIKLASFVAMPEATVNKNDRPIFREDDIWFPWKAFVVQPIAEALSPKGVSKTPLRRGVFTTYVRHYYVSL